MTVPRTKRKKKSGVDSQTKTPRLYIDLANTLNLAIWTRILCLELDFTDEQYATALESYLAYMQEVSDNRTNVKEFISDTTEMTGYDVIKILKGVTK